MDSKEDANFASEREWEDGYEDAASVPDDIQSARTGGGNSRSQSRPNADDTRKDEKPVFGVVYLVA